MGVQELIETAAPTIASAFALSRAVKIPVMCASGLTDVTAPLALAAGARGVGVGSMVNKLPSQQQMIMAVSAIASALGRFAGADNADVNAEISAQILSAPVKLNA
jgi:isopentenyl diphosphate isomerase/L-lactate dehydrogenase-like FMN-dependent dehydrogenase